MIIEWGWDDGYLGCRPKQKLYIKDDELQGMTPKEIDEYIDEEVQRAFENQVTTFWKKV